VGALSETIERAGEHCSIAREQYHQCVEQPGSSSTNACRQTAGEHTAAFPRHGELILQVRAPYCERLARGVKSDEMRSKPAPRKWTRGWTTLWFAESNGPKDEKNKAISLVHGRGTFTGDREVRTEAQWKNCNHTWRSLKYPHENSLSAFKQDMGYKRVFAWTFADAMPCPRPIRRKCHQGPVITDTFEPF